MPTVFSEIPKAFEGANGIIITLSLLQQEPSFFVFRLHQYVIVWTAVCVHVQAVCNHNKDSQIYLSDLASDHCFASVVVFAVVAVVS